MRILFIFVVLIMSQFVQAGAIEFSDKAILVKELEGNNVKSTFIGYLSKDEKTSTFRPKHLTFLAGNFLAVCLNDDFSICTLNTTFAEIYESAFKNATGRANPDLSKFPIIPAFPVTVKTSVVKFDDTSIDLVVDFAGRVTNYRIEKNSKLSSVNLKIATLSKDESIRKDVSEVDDKFKQLALSVVQIEKESDGNNTLHDSAGVGTGFFLSDDGYMMTNHHVISMYQDCLYKLYCDIKLNQTLPDNSKKVYFVRAYLMAMSVSNDFALLKIRVPTEMTIAKLAIDLKTSGDDLITFGFPGDRRNSNDQTTKLTFSFGKIIGFSGLGLISSAYIAAGASGSPILNMENLSITGIVSNGTGTSGTPEGDPGIFRPISLLDSQFGITDYLDGSKQKRIKVILAKLSNASSESEAQELLNLILVEKTYYSLPYLKQLMVNHNLAEVRKAILQALQKMDVIAGK